jgi:hypothetical protein
VGVCRTLGSPHAGISPAIVPILLPQCAGLTGMGPANINCS